MVLVPDETYKAVTPDPHCTLAYFGKAEDIEDWQLATLKRIASEISELSPAYMTAPKVTGRATFMLPPEQNDGNPYCYVDLIDWNVMPKARQLLESEAAFSINRGHGHMPHITAAYSTAWIPDLAKPSGQYSFKWASVELWIADDHTIFPIE